MLVLATVLSVFAIFAVWANRQLLDSSYWASTNTKFLENSAIRSELSSYLTNQVYANVDVAGEIRAGLPKQLKPLAGPAAGGCGDWWKTASALPSKTSRSSSCGAKPTKWPIAS